MREIKQIISESIRVKQTLLEDEEMLLKLQKVSELCTQACKSDRQVFFCGNGGSAADAQHLAAELLGRFYIDRPPLKAEALHTNSSYLTAVANDYSYDEIYSRMIQAKAHEGDVLFAISTSGNSGNIIQAARQARKQGVIVVGLTGADGGKLKSECDYLLNVPSHDTPRIQECHILLGHIICGFVEKKLFG